MIIPKGDTLSQISLGMEPVMAFSCNSIVSIVESAPSSEGMVPPRLLSSVVDKSISNTCRREDRKRGDEYFLCTK